MSSDLLCVLSPAERRRGAAALETGAELLLGSHTLPRRGTRARSRHTNRTLLWPPRVNLFTNIYEYVRVYRNLVFDSPYSIRYLFDSTRQVREAGGRLEGVGEHRLLAGVRVLFRSID